MTLLPADGCTSEVRGHTTHGCNFDDPLAATMEILGDLDPDSCTIVETNSSSHLLEIDPRDPRKRPSLYVSIEGPTGSGKSSLIKLVEDLTALGYAFHVSRPEFSGVPPLMHDTLVTKEPVETPIPDFLTQIVDGGYETFRTWCKATKNAPSKQLAAFVLSRNALSWLIGTAIRYMDSNIGDNPTIPVVGEWMRAESRWGRTIFPGLSPSNLSLESIFNIADVVNQQECVQERPVLVLSGRCFFSSCYQAVLLAAENNSESYYPTIKAVLDYHFELEQRKFLRLPDVLYVVLPGKETITPKLPDMATLRSSLSQAQLLDSKIGLDSDGELDRFETIFMREHEEAFYLLAVIALRDIIKERGHAMKVVVLSNEPMPDDVQPMRSLTATGLILSSLITHNLLQRYTCANFHPLFPIVSGSSCNLPEIVRPLIRDPDFFLRYPNRDLGDLAATIRFIGDIQYELAIDPDGSIWHNSLDASQYIHLIKKYSHFYQEPF